MDIITKLNEALLEQEFSTGGELSALLGKYKQIASNYAQIENAIAVLSDMKSNVSYLFYGGTAERLGLEKRNRSKTISSIWEEDIFSRIHPDDLLQKHLLELRFFYFMKSLPVDERMDYYIASRLRMRDGSGVYIPILHRMFYIAGQSDGSAWLALCLYNLSPDTPIHGIFNSVNGDRIKSEDQPTDDILSTREKEVLRLIDRGRMSKEIASDLSISINTVNRHRQNILEKLHVNNSIEACRIAKHLNLI